MLMKTSKIIVTLSLLFSMASSINAQTQWSCNPYDYEYDMAIYFSLLFNEETEVDMSNFELAAFCKEECRGVGDIQTITLADETNASYGYIRIYSNRIEGDTIYLKVYDKVLMEERYVEDTLVFKNQELIGLPSSPMVINFYDERPVTVTAKNYTRIYGDVNPVFEYVAEGYELKGVPVITCEANANSPIGEYPIIVSRGTVKNKRATFISGTLTINPLVASLTWSNTELTYNGQEQKPTASVSNLIGNDQCTVTVSGATNAGDYTSTASELSNANYKLSEIADDKSQAFSIAKAALTISGGTYKMRKGETQPEFQAEYYGFVNGEDENVLNSKPTLSTTATSSSNRGNYPVVVSGGDAANYVITRQDGTLTITEVIFDDGGTTIEQGEDDYFVVTIDEEDGVSSENGVISDTQLDNEGKIEVAELTYIRKLDAPSGGTGDVTIEGAAAKLYTTCLPETPTTAANAKYYTLDAANNTTLTFIEVNSLAANTPYLVAVTSGGNLDESQNLTNVMLKKEADNSMEKDGFAFKGTLTGLTNAEAAAAGAYILQIGNVWGKVTTAHTNAYIPPFRAYIVSTSSNAPELLNRVIGDGNTTGIQNIRTIDQDGTERWYDLNGKRIQPTKGVNIHNGRKVVIK